MTKKIFLFFLCFSLFSLAVGCKKSTPTSPDIPDIITPTVSTITVISNSSLMYIGSSEIFTATATMSDGGTKAVVGGVWSVDDWSVATVDASSGKITIIGSGTVNVFVDYQEKRGTKAIRGLPNYQGTWSGSYVITSCSATGDFLILDFCSFFPTGVSLIIELNLIQDEDRVEGRFLMGELGAEANGPIHADGQLLLTGAVQESGITLEVAMLLQSATPGEISGSLTQLWRAAEMTGSAQINADIENLPRISTVATMRIPRRMISPTLEDLVRALMHR